MSNFSAHKQQVKRPSVYKPIHQELEKAPRQFNDYMNSVSGRFSDICHLYLDGLSMDDVKYLKPDDLIAIVPEHQHNHKLLMTIMVRRYLYRVGNSDECETLCCKPEKPNDTYTNNNEDTCSTYSNNSTCGNGSSNTYACDTCTHSCTNSNCKHSCDDYAKIKINK